MLWAGGVGVTAAAGCAAGEQGPCVISLNNSLAALHYGSDSHTSGFVVRAEVLLLTRRVHITGPTYPRVDLQPTVQGGAGHQGIVLTQFAGGSMQISTAA